MDKDRSIRTETIKLLEENTATSLLNINHSKAFFDLSHKAEETKAKVNKWDLIKLKTFCTAKETIYKMKRQSAECEKIFSNNMTYKKLMSKIDK